MRNVIRKILLLAILGIAFVSGSSRSLQMQAAHADPMDDGASGSSGGSCN